MIRVLLPSLLVLASVPVMAKQPRYLGPPVKKPPDAGPAEPADAGARRSEIAPLLHPGDDAPLFAGALHNPQSAGMQRVDLANLVGSDAGTPAKAVLISFFATWCKPCRKELPLLQRMYTEYAGRGLRVLSVAIDKEELAWPLIGQLVQENGVTFPVVKDRSNQIARQYLGEKTELPSVFIVDREGKVALVRQGYAGDAAEFLRDEVEKALR